MKTAWLALRCGLMACPPLLARGTGDLGVLIERASSSVQII